MPMTTNSHQARSLVLIDPSVQDYKYLINGVYPGYQVHVLNPVKDGVEQITQVLSAQQDLESLHIVSHGKPGELLLGKTRLNLETIGQYASAIQTWAKALKQKAAIVLYGCEVAAEQQGQKFIYQLRDLTGLDIAASANLTGHATLGGDWVLEASTGAVEAKPAFEPQTLATYPHVLTVLLDETFRNATVSTPLWQYGISGASANPFLTAGNNPTPGAGGLPGSTTPIDSVGNGALRLTSNSGDQAAFVIYNSAFSSSAGLSITFDFFAYNGTTLATGANPGSGADGISFFLIDGAQSPTLAGAFGGSLGYAQKNREQIDGIVGGYIGVGFDEYGNFANPGDELNSSGQRQGGPGNVPDAVTVRGSGNGLTGYNFVATSGTLTPGIDNVAATNRTDATRKARIDITQAGFLSVKIDLNNDGDFGDVGEAPTALSNINIVNANGGVLPSSFKFGFASSTGSATNIHEIRNLRISTFSTPPTVADATIPVQPNSTVNVTGLSGIDAETSVSSYTITTLPDPAQGTLFLGNPASGGTAITVGQVLTAAQISQLFFQSQAGFTGSNFTYRGADTDGDTSQALGTITLVPQGSPTNVTEKPQITDKPKLTDSSNLLQSTCAPGVNLKGTNRNNKLVGGPDADRLRGLKGNDTLRGKGCNDRVRGGRGNDQLLGGNGNDIVLGGQNNDRMNGGRGIDFMNGGLGRDRIKGGGGRDIIFGRRSNDLLKGNGGNDRLNGNLGRDRVFGGKGKDVIQGGRDNDRLDGDKGDDLIGGGLQKDVLLGRGGFDNLAGKRGNDRLRGGSQADILLGGLGRDVLIGGGGKDILKGGSGPDRFIYRNARQGLDRILGFGVKADRIDLKGILAKENYSSSSQFDQYIRLKQVGNDTIVRVDANGNAPGGFVSLCTLTNVNASSLSVNNFIV